MSTTNGALLSQARQVLKTGQKNRARQLLKQASRRDPSDHRPWLYLAGLSPSPDTSRAYLDRAAALNPGDPNIEKALAWNNQRLAQPVPAPEAKPARLSLPPRDLAWTLLASLVLVLLVAAGEWLALLSPLRLALGFAFVLFVPGYWLTSALFPSREDIDGIERLGLSLGLSVAWVPVLALILDRLPALFPGVLPPGGLRLWPILIGTLASVFIFAAVALWRRSRLPAGEAYLPNPIRPRAWWRAQPLPDRRLYLLVSGVLLLALLAVAWVLLVPSPDEFMTEFYMLGPEGLAENFPRQAAPGELLAVTLGLANRERDAHTYRVEAWAVDPFEQDSRTLVAETPPLTLPSGETLEWPQTWSMPWVGDDQQVQFLLYIDQNPDPYRQLRLWLNVIK